MYEPHGDNPLLLPGALVLLAALVGGGFWLDYQWKKRIVKDAVEEVLREHAGNAGASPAGD